MDSAIAASPGRCDAHCTPVFHSSFAGQRSIRRKRSFSWPFRHWTSSACAARSCAASHFRDCRSPHDPPATRTLVRTAGRSRRCRPGTRSAGGIRRGRARGAADGRAARRARGYPSASPAVRGIVAPLSRLLARRSVPGFSVSRAARDDARTLPRPCPCLGGGGRARDPAIAAWRIGACGARAVAPRSRCDDNEQRRLRANRRCRPPRSRPAVRVSARLRAGVSVRPARSTLRRRRLAACACGGHGGRAAAARAAGHFAQGTGLRHAGMAAHRHGAQRGVCRGEAGRACP